MIGWIMTRMRRAAWRASRVGAPAGVLIVAFGGSVGCAATVRPPLPSPDEIPSLEASLAATPGELAVQVRLGVAYREAGRLEGARNILERAVTQDPTDPAAVLYLGLTYEDMDLPAQARALYTQYIAVGNRDDVKRMLAARLPILERQELLIAVRGAVAREAELANTPPEVGTVAVFPFAYQGADPQFRPLGRALAEMLVTDLSQTERLRVLERTRIQLLVEEMDLGDSGLADSLTTARSGRLLGAERIVQGQINVNETLLRLQAAIVGSSTGQLAGQPLVEEDALQQLFEMQKRLAFNLYESLGIQLTPAERERISQIPTQNLQALLAYGQCLEAEDAGQFAEAAGFCSQAAALDPAFAAARAREERTTAAAASSQVTVEQLASLGTPEMRQAPGAQQPGAPRSELPGLEAVQALLPRELPRAPVPEALGTDELGRSTTVDIIIRRP
jgi:TolB-like protein